MNILSKILLSGFDVKLESASWSEVIDGLTYSADKFYFKLEIRQHNGESMCMGAVSAIALQGDKGDEMILHTLEQMWKITEGK